MLILNIIQHANRLPYGVTPIQKLQLQSEDYMEQGVEEKTLFDLKEVDPYTEKVETKHILILVTMTYMCTQNSHTSILYCLQDKRFQCTVTLLSVAEKEQWCYRACRVCNSTIIPGDDGYKCTKATGCSCKQFEWK
jgi:replication factor A1